MKSRQGTSFLSSGYWCVACEPRQRHHVRRNGQTHLPLGLISLYGACPVCLAHRSCGPVPVAVRMTFDLTGLLPASPVRKDGCKGSYTKMAVFLTGKLRPEGREGFTQKRCPLTALRCGSLFEQRALCNVNYFMLPLVKRWNEQPKGYLGPAARSRTERLEARL